MKMIYKKEFKEKMETKLCTWREKEGLKGVERNGKKNSDVLYTCINSL